MTDQHTQAGEREALLPCPFCGDEGEKGRQTVTKFRGAGEIFDRIICRCCGAICPEQNWNSRAALSQSAGSAEPVIVECRECVNCGHVGIDDMHDTNAHCSNCDWHGPSPSEDACPGCAQTGTMGAACPKCSDAYRLLCDAKVAAPQRQAAGDGLTDEQIHDLWCSIPTQGGIDEDIVPFARALLAIAAPRQPGEVVAGVPAYDVKNEVGLSLRDYEQIEAEASRMEASAQQDEREACDQCNGQRWILRGNGEDSECEACISDNGSDMPPFTGHWRGGNGVISCGTLRIFSENFDTNPADHIKAGIVKWVCDTLNAAQKGQQVRADATTHEPDYSVLGAAMRAIEQAIQLIDAPDHPDKVATIRRVLRGAVVIAEADVQVQADAGAVANAEKDAEAAKLVA